MMQCPFCPSKCRDLFGISLHIEDSHPDIQGDIDDGKITITTARRLPVVEVDIDAVHLKFGPKGRR